MTLSADVQPFYRDLRWARWENDVKDLAGDRCYSFYPFLWTKEGSPDGSDRRLIPAAEAFEMKMDIVRQLKQR